MNLNVIIGEDCMFARQILILASDFHSILNHDGHRINYSNGITLGNHVWVATKATILKNSHIGSNSIIAAGAVVSNGIPSNSIAGGVPTKLIKENIDWIREIIVYRDKSFVDSTMSVNISETNQQICHLEHFPDINDLYFRGWAFIRDVDSCNSYILLELIDAYGKVTVLQAEVCLRYDVSDHYANQLYLQSGFICKVNQILDLIQVRLIVQNGNIVTSNVIFSNNKDKKEKDALLDLKESSIKRLQNYVKSIIK